MAFVISRVTVSNSGLIGILLLSGKELEYDFRKCKENEQLEIIIPSDLNEDGLEELNMCQELLKLKFILFKQSIFPNVESIKVDYGCQCYLVEKIYFNYDSLIISSTVTKVA